MKTGNANIVVGWRMRNPRNFLAVQIAVVCDPEVYLTSHYTRDSHELAASTSTSPPSVEDSISTSSSTGFASTGVGSDTSSSAAFTLAMV